MTGSTIYGLAYSAASLEYLRQVPQKFRKQIIEKVKTLTANPHPPTAKMLKNVTENGDQVYRVRSGDYRALYVVRENPEEIVVIDIGHRKDVYR